MAIVLTLSALPAASAPDAVARGAYLAAAAGCDQCHTDTKRAGKPYAGGREFASRWGTVATPNITPDRATGIGKWSSADFARAMRWGVAPDDSHYLPVFPFLFYSRLSDSDLGDLKAFLDSLPAVSRTNDGAASPLFSGGHVKAAVAVKAEPPAGPWQPDPAKDAAWNRGAYLVATVGRCGDCHTPTEFWGGRNPTRFLAGVAAGPHGKKAPNITPDLATGIGSWSADDIVTLLTDGQTPDFDFVGGDMAAIVNCTARITDADRRAIAVYLQTIPARILVKKR